VTAAVNVYAHLPDVPIEGQYRMGADLVAGADDMWFNTTLDDGTVLAVGEPDGWEGVTFITPVDQAGGRDGGLTGPPSVGPRILPISGVMVSPDPQTLRNRIRQMRGLLGPRTQVVWEQYDFGEAQRMGLVCVANGDFRATPVTGHRRGGVATVFQFSLTAANPPWKLAVGTASQACMGLPSGTVSGRTYSKTYSWNYGPFVNPGGFMNVSNDGDIAAWPVLTITGPADNPIITNDTTGEGFVITSSIPAGVTVTIDSRTGVINPSNYRIAGRPFALQPGNNTLRWRATSGTYDARASLCATWRSTWE
jgi:Phage tail protein